VTSREDLSTDHTSVNLDSTIWSERGGGGFSIETNLNDAASATEKGRARGSNGANRVKEKVDLWLHVQDMFTGETMVRPKSKIGLHGENYPDVDNPWGGLLLVGAQPRGGLG